MHLIDLYVAALQIANLCFESRAFALHGRFSHSLVGTFERLAGARFGVSLLRHYREVAVKTFGFEDHRFWRGTWSDGRAVGLEALSYVLVDLMVG